MELNQDSADRSGKLLRPLTFSRFLLLLLGRLLLLALLGICLPSLWSPPFPPHALALISLSLVKVRRSLTLTRDKICVPKELIESFAVVPMISCTAFKKIIASSSNKNFKTCYCWHIFDAFQRTASLIAFLNSHLLSVASSL